MPERSIACVESLAMHSQTRSSVPQILLFTAELKYEKFEKDGISEMTGL